MSIRVAIVVDAQGQPGQVEEILESLKDIGLKCDLVAQGRGLHLMKDRAIDLLILDYGGAAYGSMDMMEWQLEEARTYAEDHPSSLLVVWTDHTSHYYQELHKTMPQLPNILLRFTDGWYETGVPFVQKWFSVNSVE